MSALVYSDSVFSVVVGYRSFVDVIDEAWKADVLEDDELELAADAELPLEAEDGIGGAVPGVIGSGIGSTPAGGVAGAEGKAEEKWTELGLESF